MLSADTTFELTGQYIEGRLTSGGSHRNDSDSRTVRFVQMNLKTSYSVRSDCSLYSLGSLTFEINTAYKDILIIVYVMDIHVAGLVTLVLFKIEFRVQI